MPNMGCSFTEAGEMQNVNGVAKAQKNLESKPLR